MNLQKVLGCTGRQLRHQVWIEFGILGGGAAIIGTLLSLATSYLLSVQVFDRVWSFSLGSAGNGGDLRDRPIRDHRGLWCP